MFTLSAHPSAPDTGEGRLDSFKHDLVAHKPNMIKVIIPASHYFDIFMPLWLYGNWFAITRQPFCLLGYFF